MTSPLTFSQALTQAEAQARSTLDVALHARLSAAVSLVKDGRVFQATDGRWEVDSTTTQGLVYSVNGSCPCVDVHFNHPHGGLCKHRIAVYLARRVRQLLHQPPAPMVPEIVEPWPDNDVEEPPPAPEAPARLPEAPASVNVRVQVAGREVQWTLRDHDEARLAGRLEALLARYPTGAPPQTSSREGWCRQHRLQMTQSHKAGRSWWSHRLENGSWCKGR